MSVPQYLRQISLKIGNDQRALDLSDLRVRFSIRRGDISTPNSADIRIYNVNDETKRLAKSEFERVVLQVGYEGNLGLIFDGTVMQVRRGRESQTDTYIDITAADGDSAYNFSVINCAMAAGATLDDQLNACLKAMEPYGIALGHKPTLPANQLPRGKVLSGMVRDYLDTIAEAASAKWSIQDGKLYLIPLGDYLPGEALEINAATGMVGLPEQTINGINLRMLLNPGVKIGRLIRLNNASIQQARLGLGINSQVPNALLNQQGKINDDGLYYVMVANHSGDTRGNEWYTNVICLAVDASVPSALIRQSTAADPIQPIKPFG